MAAGGRPAALSELDEFPTAEPELVSSPAPNSLAPPSTPFPTVALEPLDQSRRERPAVQPRKGMPPSPLLSRAADAQKPAAAASATAPPANSSHAAAEWTGPSVTVPVGGDADGGGADDAGSAWASPAPRVTAARSIAEEAMRARLARSKADSKIEPGRFADNIMESKSLDRSERLEPLPNATPSRLALAPSRPAPSPVPAAFAIPGVVGEDDDAQNPFLHPPQSPLPARQAHALVTFDPFSDGFDGHLPGSVMG